MTGEKPLAIAELAREIKRIIGVEVNPATVYRWTTRGVKGVVLETMSIGSKVYTTWSKYETFKTAIGVKRVPALAAESATKARSKRVADADKVLRKAGII